MSAGTKPSSQPRTAAERQSHFENEMHQLHVRIREIGEAIAALRDSQVELATATLAALQVTLNRKEDTVHINKAFWLKLARLAALVEQLESAQAVFHNFMRSHEWTKLETETQDTLRAHAKVIDDILHID